MIMNRRDFIRTVGKGATAAGVSPKTVGKMLMNVAGGAAAPTAVSAAPLNLAAFNQALKRLDSLSFDAAFPGFISAANQKVIASSLKSDLLKVLPVFADYDIDFSDKADATLNDLNKVLKGEMDLRDTTIFMGQDFGDMFIEHIPYEHLFKHGLLDQNFKKYFIDKHGEFYWARLHFKSLHGPGMKSSEWHKFLKENYPKTYEKVISQHKKNLDRSNYRKLAKSVDYSRIDKAGSAEDEGYAKYYEELKQFGTLLENMNRRDFLRTVGKGVTAATGQSLVPKGVVGSVLKGAMNIVPAVSKAFNLEKELLYFLQPERFLKFTGKWHQATTFEEAQIALTGLRTNYTRIYDALKTKDPSIGKDKIIKQEYNDTMKYLDLIQDDINLSGGKISHNHSYDPELTNLEHISSALAYFSNDIITPVMSGAVWESGLITPEMAANLKQKYGIDKDDYDFDFEPYKPIDSGMNAAEIDKWVYDQTAKDIDYSRMDKAGGSEDVGYAKYYEELKQFGTLLENMNRRDFIRTVGKGATAAGVSPKTVGKMLMNVAGGAAPAAASTAPLSAATISQALKRLDTFAYNLGNEGFVTAANQKVIASTLKSDLLKILPAFASKGIDFKMGEKGLQELDKVLKGEMDLTDTVIYSTGEPSEFNEYIPFSDALKNGYINQDFKNYYIDKWGEQQYAELHFRSLPESRIQDFDEREKKWLEFCKKHYPETYKSEKSWRDWVEKNRYDDIASDIDYSRMDTAGGAEDKGYAKYYEELKQFGTLLENMNRRGFLKTVGRGASLAGANPKSVGKMLMNVAGGAAPATASAAPLNIAAFNQALKRFDNLSYAIGNWGFVTKANEKVIASTLKSDLLKLLPVFASKGIDFEIGEKALKQLDEVLKGKMNLLKTVIQEPLVPMDFNELIPYSDIIKNGLMNQDFKNYFIDAWGERHFAHVHFFSLPESRVLDINERDKSWLEFCKKNYPKTYKREKAWRDSAEKRKWYKQTAKDINYSRMDRAGSTEDEGYAKYYEKVNTFDQLLSVVKEADDDIISGDTEGIEPGETGMPRGFGHPDRNRNYDDTIRLNVIYGVPEDVDNAYNTAAGKKLQQFVKQQLPWLDEYSPESNLFDPRLTYYDIANELQRVYEFFKYWVETEDYDKKASHHVERKEQAMYFLQQYPGALNNFSRVFKFIDFLYGDSPSNPENVSNYPLHVSLYDTTRELGGHQEGGWWYDVVRLVYSIPVTNLKQAEAAAKKLYNNLNKVNIDGKPTIILEKYKGSIDTTNNPKPEYE